MTHEILFRGKRADDGEWIESSSIKQMSSDEIFLLGGRCWIKVVPSTVGRYTGLTDKNGRKIFEGDILSAHFDEAFPENVTFMEVGNNGFAFTLGQAGLEPELIDKLDAEWCNERFEVAGNIYDDSKLMGGENNA